MTNMKGYINTIKNFLSSTEDEIIFELKQLYPQANESLIRSWHTLVSDVKNSENITDLPENCTIAIEYSLSTDAMAVDLMFLGFDKNNKKNAVMIESKQWNDEFIKSHNFACYREAESELHPQIQISRYKLSFCDYLNAGHNYTVTPYVFIRNCSSHGITELIEKNPSNTAVCIPIYNKIDKIICEACKKIVMGSTDLISELKNATFKPSKSIEDAMNAIVSSEEAFVLTPEQEKAITEINESIKSGKKIIRITGDAGSGKTAVLLNLYVQYINSKDSDIFPIFISGAQNTAYYRSKYKRAEYSFSYSYTTVKTIKQNSDKTCIVLMDEAQHNEPNLITKIINEDAVVVLCYDVKQIIYADNPIKELKEIEMRDDFTEVELTGSVRFNGSQVAEENIRNCLKGNTDCKNDDLFEFKIFNNLGSFQQKITETIQNNPESSVAVIGLLSEDYENYLTALNPQSRLFAKWGIKEECNWLPYINRKNYLNENNGELWVGTWWLPGLDVDYVAVIAGGDVKLTANGIKAVPKQSKNYRTMISVARKMNFPEKIISNNNSETVKNIIEFINKPGNEKIKSKYISSFSKYLRNIYYIMLTRGKKGCFVYFTNSEL